MQAASEQGRIDFSSRISARAVVIGATLVLALLTVLVALGGALGLMPSGPVPDAKSVRDAGVGLVLWGALSWIVASFAGAFVASVSSRALLRRDGFLHGVATWGVACLTAGILSCVWFMSAISTNLVSRDLTSVFWTRGAFFSFAIADALAVIAALAGGLFGAQSETRAARRAEATQERPPIAIQPAPQPT